MRQITTLTRSIHSLNCAVQPAQSPKKSSTHTALLCQQNLYWANPFQLP